MYISKKKTLKILAYCATSMIFFGGTASAAEEEGASASGNEVTVTGDNYSGGNIFAGNADEGESSDNILNVSDITTSANQIDAGWSSDGSTRNNILNIWNVHDSSGFFHGGYAHGAGNSINNTINFYGGTAYEIHGGHAISGNALNNTVNFYDGTLVGEMGGGYSETGNVNYNTLNIYGGTINGNVYGGRASYSGSGSSGDAIGDTINVSGGAIDGSVYGGWAPNGYARDNTLNISGSPDLSNASLYAGLGMSDDAVSGNTLNIFTKNITAKNIYGFESLNFYLPSGIQNGDTLLTLTNGATDLTSTTVNLNAFGGNIQTGNVINLLTNTNGINISDVTNDGTISQGISLDYGLTLGLNDAGTAYTATVGERIGNGLKDQTKALTSAVIDTASLLDSGTDRLLEWLPESIELTGGAGDVVDTGETGSTGGVDLNSIPTTGFDPFAGIGGSVVKIKTGDGSSLKSKNGGLNVGMARYLRNRHGIFVFGPVTDYGQDHYESTMEDGTKGAGNSKYFTAGIIARQMNYGGMYYEGSARMGRIQTNFVSDNFLVHNVPTHAYYDSSSPCYSGHVRIGWRNNVSKESILDAYGVYSLNHVSGMTADVSTGETYTFSGVSSGRMRLGARLTRSIHDDKRFYSGIAFVHEFTGETQGNYMGMSTKKSSLKGNYGIIELGWQTKPSKNSPILIDASLVGVMGDHKGLTISAKFKKDF